MKFDIKARFSGATLFTAEIDAKFETSSECVKLGEAAKAALKSGVNLYGVNLYGVNLYGADLRGADLGGADLRGADLRGADLRGADLYGADLRAGNLYGADLRGADLRGADLRGADLRAGNLYGVNLYGVNLYGVNLYGVNLYGADLYGADLRGADLGGADLGEGKTLKLIETRNFMQLGPLGSRGDNLLVFNTDVGVYVRAGCFFDTLAAFKEAVVKTHGDNQYGRDYAAAIVMLEAYFAGGA